MAGTWEDLQPFEPQSGVPDEIGAVHLVHLPNGKFLAFAGGNGVRLWTPPPITSPGRGTFESKPNLNRQDIFCAGHCALADGRVFLAGGAWVLGFATKQANVFDTTTSTWNPAPYPPPDVTYNRWYPTCTMLGTNSSGVPHLKILVTLGRIHQTQGGFASIDEICNPATAPGSWAIGADIGIIGTYPFNFVLQDGRVFCAGPRRQTRVLDANLTTWTNGPNNIQHPESSHGSAVTFEPGKVLKVGGSLSGVGEPGVKTMTRFDMTVNPPVLQGPNEGIALMAFGRRNHNLTVLPDGKILITGGNLIDSNDQPVFEPELYDPVANTISTLPPMDSNGPRWYHSVAGLLPDGRVVVAGGNNHPAQQIFRPPYLDGSPTRPVIGSGPSSMTYGNTYTWTYTPTTMAISKVALIKLCSVTHGFCHDQRYVPLAFSASGGTVTVISPANANIAPPGFYMLWLVNSAGVPSESKYGQVGP